MSKAFRAASTSTSTSLTPKVSAGFVIFIVFAIALVIGLVTRGVSPMIGLPLAIAGAFAIDRVLFGSRR